MKIHINEETGFIWLELSKLQAARLFDKTEIHTISCKSANLTRGDKIPNFEELETVSPLHDVESFAIKLGEVVDLHRGLCDTNLEILNLLMPDVHKFRLREDILKEPKTTLGDVKALDELKSKLSNAKEVDWSKSIPEKDKYAIQFLFMKVPKADLAKALSEILKVPDPNFLATTLLKESVFCEYITWFSIEQTYVKPHSLQEAANVCEELLKRGITARPLSVEELLAPPITESAKKINVSKAIPAAECEEEPCIFLMFIAIPERKLQTVKSIKEILEIGLQEAKDIADKTSADELPLSNTSYTRTKATNLQAQLHEQGITVIIGTISTLDKLRIKTYHLRVHAVTNSMTANKFAEELRITLRLDRENAIQAYKAIMINNSYTLGTLYTKAQAIKKREALQRSGIVTTVIE